MALPPEQINIKRRREEEPVETLYIQSDLHQKKRRFTDFIFQRVRVGGGGDDESPSPPPFASSAQTRRALRTPRSVSSINFSSNASGNGGISGAGTSHGAGVPLVRATSAGAELREEKRLAALRKGNEEKMRKALYSTHSSPGLAPTRSAGQADSSNDRLSLASSAASSPGKSSITPSVRKFQISRSSTPSSLLKASGGGIQKRRGVDGAPGVAVLVEKLRRQPHSREASMVADIAFKNATPRESTAAQEQEATQPVRPRKRPIVNRAEKRWREEQKATISAAKQNLAETLEKEARSHNTTWEDESDRLARQFEEIALELDNDVNAESTQTKELSSKPAAWSGVPKPPLKYQPRSPNRPRSTTEQKEGAPQVHMQEEMQVDPAPADEQEDDSDTEYVYDTYIRRPLPEGSLLTNPLTKLETDSESWLRQNGIDPTHHKNIGVIVITPEDEEYWENFAEEDEDEDKWDSEDADSNAENNPANDYPDEELSSEDEYDDPTAVYSRYRHRAASDDEEFDADDVYDSEGASPGRYGYGFRSGSRRHVNMDNMDMDMDSDEASDDEGFDGSLHRRW